MKKFITIVVALYLSTIVSLAQDGFNFPDFSLINDCKKESMQDYITKEKADLIKIKNWFKNVSNALMERNESLARHLVSDNVTFEIKDEISMLKRGFLKRECRDASVFILDDFILWNRNLKDMLGE